MQDQIPTAEPNEEAVVARLRSPQIPQTTPSATTDLNTLLVRRILDSWRKYRFAKIWQWLSGRNMLRFNARVVLGLRIHSDKRYGPRMAWVGKVSLHNLDKCSTTQSISRYLIKPLVVHGRRLGPSCLGRNLPSELAISVEAWSSHSFWRFISEEYPYPYLRQFTAGHLFTVAHKWTGNGLPTPEYTCDSTVRSPWSLQRCIPLNCHACR
jgi:hypothetical protein